MKPLTVSKNMMNRRNTIPFLTMGAVLAGLLTFMVYSPLKGQTPAQEPPQQNADQVGPQSPASSETTSSPDTKTESTPATAEPTLDASRESPWQFVVKGGLTMIPLGIVSTFILAFALERFFFFRRQKVSTKGFSERVQKALNDGGVEGVFRELENDNLLLARILKMGLQYRHQGIDRVEKIIETEASVEIGRLERGLNMLNNLGNLAPLLGFFGTVTGMRNSFLQFAIKAAPTARDLASGVEEALITTIAGLIIAIPAYFVYNMFLYYIDTLTIELEKNAATILSRMD